MKFISTKVHGVLDYLLGLALIFAPAFFNFTAVSGPALAIPRMLGVLIILNALFTRYELGLFKTISMRAHLAVDYVGSIFLALSPWLFGFANEAPRMWVPYVIVAALYFIVSLVTELEPERRVTYAS